MYRNSVKSIITPLLVAVGVAVGVLIGVLVSGGKDVPVANNQVRKEIDKSSKIGYAVSLIENLYMDSVNMDTLSDKILPELFGELDPHTVYIPAKDLKQVNEPLEGEFDGIGVVFNMATDTIVVLNVIRSGPSDKAGVQNGDRIITINDSIVAGQKYNEDQNIILKKLRGKRGTKVNLGLERKGIKDLVKVTVERGVIPIKSLDAAFMIEPKIGFIKLSAFSRTSYKELKMAMDTLRSKGMESLIFDLRGNAGGFLDQAITIANEFLPEGKLIVYTEDKYKRKMTEYSDGKGKLLDLNLVVLIDEGSASSSEILAGAIQDNDRGLVIGRRSFGKGLVQQQIPFGDGSAVRLTVAKYFTPTGRSIQKPYVKGKSGEYQEDLQARFAHDEFFVADSIKFADSLKFTTPGGKIVYGGGGIMPDVFMPMDTTDVTKYFIEVRGRNILYRYTLDYTDRHREVLNNINSVAELTALLDADKNLFDDFVAYATKNGVKPNWSDIRKSKYLMEAQIRSYIGRNTPLEDVGFYANIYPIDDTLIRAVEELKRMTKIEE